MKRIIIAGAVFTFLLLLVSTNNFAQSAHHGGYQYNTASVATVSGEITSIESVTRGWGGSTGTHLVLNTGSGALTVYAGPSWFLQDKVQLVRGDRIEVTGSRINVDGKPGIVAKEIKKGASVVVLRNNDGTPLWAGHGRRHGR